MIFVPQRRQSQALGLAQFLLVLQVPEAGDDLILCRSYAQQKVFHRKGGANFRILGQIGYHGLVHGITDAALAGLQVAEDDPDQGGLAAAVFTDQGDLFLLRNDQVYPVQDAFILVWIAIVDVF